MANRRNGGSGLEIGGVRVAPGSRRRIDLDFVRLPAQAHLSLPVEALAGSAAGRDTPVLWLSGAIHGDELNGVEIIHRVLDRIEPEGLRGGLLAVPVVNIFGFAFQSRYLPDRRDLNRSFPGSERGSLAARLAHFFFHEIVSRSTHGIDLHTGSNYRTNLPQIRADLDDPEARRLAAAFRAPVMIHGDSPSGSLRRAARRAGKPIVVYEAGEPLRFDEQAIELGVHGILRVMADLGMIDQAPRLRVEAHECGPNLEVRRRTWVRAPLSGIFTLRAALGDRVTRGQLLGSVYEPLGPKRRQVKAPRAGIVLGHTSNPLAYQGDALVHLGHPENDGPS